MIKLCIKLDTPFSQCTYTVRGFSLGKQKRNVDTSSCDLSHSIQHICVGKTRQIKGEFYDEYVTYMFI